MKIGINLATQPFRRDRPVLVAAGVLSTLLVALLGGLIYLAVAERGELADARRNVDLLQRRIRVVSGQQQKLDAVLRQPENAEVLERSQFLNALLYRKGISWTRLFEDLEKVLPPNVRLIQIRPQVVSERQVYLEMLVGAESPAPVIELLSRFASSEVFGATTVPSFVPPSQTDPLYRYRVSVNYAQKL